MTLIGTTVGRIRIVEALGKGGMGEIYLGYDETLKRQVALKAIRGERRLEAEAKARFLREARILSQLDHPNICRIHEFIEGDESDFLVLELIAGQSLKKALEEGLDESFKLHVAERVAAALVAAHAKGVAHRDLKPENVMVTPEGDVKVLDFGLAHTADEPVVASRALAGGEDPGDVGPGEGENEDEDVGTRDKTAVAARRPAAALAGMEPSADSTLAPTILAPGHPAAPGVSAPGGELPAPPWTLPGLSLDPTRVPRPRAAPRTAASYTGRYVQTQLGTVMGTVGYMSPEQARGERATPAGDMHSFGLLLQELFTGRPPYEIGLPLPVLLMKVAEGDTLPVTGLDPDLTELVTRLESVAPGARPSALEAAELLRWIRGKRARRLLRRVAAVILVALVLAALKYTLDLRRERRVAEEARRVAEEAVAEAENVSEFLVGLFASSNPAAARGNTVTAREILDAGARRIPEELSGHPLVQSRIMLTMGRAYRQLGLYREAMPLVEGALELHVRHAGEGHLETAGYLDQLASLLHDRGEYERAEPFLARALEIRETALGPRDVHVAASLNNLAFLYNAQGRGDLAEPLFRRALAIQREAFGGEHPDVAASLNNLGELYRTRGEYADAEPFLRQAVEMQEKLLGPDHPDLAFSLNNLAIVYHEQGEAAPAEALYRRTLAISEKVLGPEHPNVAVSLINLANLSGAHGDRQKAGPLYERAIAIQEKFLGAAHPDLATTLNYLADLRVASREYERAEPLYRRALEIQEKAFGGDHPSVANTLADLAGLHIRQRHYAEAEALYERSRASTERLLAEQPESRPLRGRLAATLVGQGELRRAMGSNERAVELWRRAADLMKPLAAGSDVVALLHTRALALLYLGRVDEASPMTARLLAKGWSDPDFVELCREHGLL